MTAKRASLYTPHPGFKMEEAYHRNLKERTGKTLDQWIGFVKKSGPAGERARTDWLKKDHGLTTNYAVWIAQSVEGKGLSLESYDPEAMVEEMFAGSKAGLRPIYDRLLKLGLSLGKDVKASPGKTMVPLYRNRLFARLTPSTRTRLDLGLALDESTKATGRLINIQDKSKNRINRQISISTLDEIDDEVKRWLKTAYDLDA
jgi:Domain of unknown function (DUF5655)/Domain of unknown function (DUF4287)